MITFHFSSLNFYSINLWFSFLKIAYSTSLISSNQRLLRVWVYIVNFYIACCVKVSFIENFSFHLSIVSIFGSIMVSLWSWGSSCIIDISWGVVSLSVPFDVNNATWAVFSPFSYIFVKMLCVSFKFHYNYCELYI